MATPSTAVVAGVAVTRLDDAARAARVRALAGRLEGWNGS